MRIACSCLISSLNDAQQNLTVLEGALALAQAQACQLVLFGESFLQGFDCLNFTYKDDIRQAYSVRGSEVGKVRSLAIKYQLAIGFGLIENYKGTIYSSFLVIDRAGKTIHHYRRVSPGWRIPTACSDYREGKCFKSFTLENKTFGTMVCGDFWEDDLLTAIISMDQDVDLFLWPVHCDYEIDFWQTSECSAYADRSQILAKPVLFINNHVPDQGRAKGGAYLWHQGKSRASLDPGLSQLLIVDF